jgi:hypothetical protein
VQVDAGRVLVQHGARVIGPGAFPKRLYLTLVRHPRVVFCSCPSEVADMLVSVTSCDQAIEARRPFPELQTWLALGAPVNAAPGSGQVPPLFAAAECGDPALVHLLLSAGADVNYYVAVSKPDTAFDKAIAAGQLEAARLMTLSPAMTAGTLLHGVWVAVRNRHFDFAAHLSQHAAFPRTGASGYLLDAIEDACKQGNAALAEVRVGFVYRACCSPNPSSPESPCVGLTVYTLYCLAAQALLCSSGTSLTAPEVAKLRRRHASLDERLRAAELRIRQQVRRMPCSLFISRHLLWPPRCRIACFYRASEALSGYLCVCLQAEAARAATLLAFMQQPGWRLAAWMQKAGPQEGFMTWNRRFFVLAHGQPALYYFEKEVRCLPLRSRAGR